MNVYDFLVLCQNYQCTFINVGRLWVYLAMAEQQLGLTDITDEMIAEMERNVVFCHDASKHWI
jgi:hypothetical protein